MDAESVRNPAGEIDWRVGAAVLARREALDMSVASLAAKLEVTPEQVRKYESGEARVSASRLFYISHLLHLPLSAFYAEDGEGERDAAPLNEPVQVALALPGRRQQMVLDMARSIARAQLSD